jgi:spore maturation protein CgeB
MMWLIPHLPPPEDREFYSSSVLTRNIPRAAWGELGHGHRGRLFEAGGCVPPVVSDWWEGLDSFFEPGREILIARSTADVIDALSLDEGALDRERKAARDRTLAEHTARHRAEALVEILESPPRPLLRPERAVAETSAERS